MTGRTTTRGISRKKPATKSAASTRAKTTKATKTTKTVKSATKSKVVKPVKKTAVKKSVVKKASVKSTKAKPKTTKALKEEKPVSLTKSPALRMKEKVVLLTALVDKKLEKPMYHIARTGGMAVLMLGLIMTGSALAQFDASGNQMLANTAGTTTSGGSTTTTQTVDYSDMLSIDTDLPSDLVGQHNFYIYSNHGYPTQDAYLKDLDTGAKIYLDLIETFPDHNKTKYAVEVSNAVSAKYTLFVSVDVDSNYYRIQGSEHNVDSGGQYFSVTLDPEVSFSSFPDEILDREVFRVDYKDCPTLEVKLASTDLEYVHELSVYEEVDSTRNRYKILADDYDYDQYFVQAYCHTDVDILEFTSEQFYIGVDDTALEEDEVDYDSAGNPIDYVDVEEVDSTVNATDTVDYLEEETEEIVEEKIQPHIQYDDVRSTKRYRIYEIIIPENDTVSVWLEPVVADTPTYLGKATHVADDQYAYSLDVETVADGTYYIYAMTDYAGATIRTNKKEVYIEKPDFSVNREDVEIEAGTTDVAKQTAEETTTVIEKVEEVDVVVTKAYDEEDETNVEEESVLEFDQIDTDATSDEVIDEASVAVREITDSLFDRYQDRVDNAISRYITALRSNDEVEIERAKRNLTSLQEDIILEAYKLDGADDLIAEIEEVIEDTIGEYREKTEKVEEIIFERTDGDISKDTDQDGISDYDEVKIYKTDPTNPDSDQDGFIDGAEILNGFDPIDASYEATINYESPKDSGVVREDILVVESVSPIKEVKNPDIITDQIVTDTLDEEGGSDPTVMITGKALPNSFVTLYIFSTPVIVTIKTSDDGSWMYTFDKELEDGSHEVYVGITDNTGSVIAKSKPFAFVKEAQAFTPVDADVAATTISPIKDSSSPTSPISTTLIVGLALLICGLILVMLGQSLRSMRTREEEELIVPA